MAIRIISISRVFFLKENHKKGIQFDLNMVMHINRRSYIRTTATAMRCARFHANAMRTAHTHT